MKLLSRNNLRRPADAGPRGALKPCALTRRMEKNDFFELIQQRGLVEPAAIDGLKRTVERIARRLARGESVHLPGVGKLIPQVRKSILFQSGAKPKRRAGGGGR